MTTKQNEDKPVASGLFRQPQHNAENPLVVIGCKAQPPATPPQGVAGLLKPSRYAGTDERQAAYSKGAHDQWLDDRIHLNALEQEHDQARAQVADLLQATKAALAAISQQVQWSSGKNQGSSFTIVQGDCAIARKFLTQAIARAENKGEVIGSKVRNS